MEFQKFDSIARLYRQVTITEKIDGMNAAIVIEELPSGTPPDSSPIIKVVDRDEWPYAIAVQSRKQFLTLDNDLHGLAAWVYKNAEELVALLGPGHHFGEYWGRGINRSYHQKRNWFSLFNTKRWNKENTQHIDGLLTAPVLYDGPYEDWVNQMQLHRLETEGSYAAREVDDRKLDFRAEGIVGWHHALNMYYKVTLGGDGHKGLARQAFEARKQKEAGYPDFNQLIGVTHDPSIKHV